MYALLIRTQVGIDRSGWLFVLSRPTRIFHMGGWTQQTIQQDLENRVGFIMRLCFTIATRYLAAVFLITTGIATYSCTDTGSIDPGPQLAGLSVPGTSLQPPFTKETTHYNVDLPLTTAAITVVATKSDPSDVVSGAITLPAGQTTGQAVIPSPGPGSSKDVSLTVTSPDGRAKVYTITLRTAVGGDNTLQSLAVSSGILSPAFSAGTQDYRVDVDTNVTEVTVSATKSDANAVLSGDVPDQGQATIKLDGPGTTKVVSILVTAPDGTSKAYSITINRAAPSSDSNLSGLTVTPGSLEPDFDPGILNYTASVANDVDSVVISATKSDPNAVMSSSGSVIASAGTPTGQLSVRVRGRRTEIGITVIAPDGLSTKTYGLTIIRSRR